MIPKIFINIFPAFRRVSMYDLHILAVFQKHARSFSARNIIHVDNIAAMTAVKILIWSQLLFNL